MSLRYLSVCSGIEAASVAWHSLGWVPVAFSEIETFPSAVLQHHFPHVPNLGDMTKFHEWPDLDIDLLAGGCPCQAFSVAGLREGLNDPRGNLTLTFLGVADRYRPRWIVYENVPGILSDKTNAFGCLLAGLGELGYGVAYAVIDAQYFGVAQRRKRVFVVGYLGDWKRAAEALAIGEGLLWNSPPSRGAQKDVAGTIAARTRGGGGLGTDFDLAGGIQVSDADDGLHVDGKWPAEIAPTLNAHFGDKQGLEDQHALNGGYLSRAIAGTLTHRDDKSARMDADTNHLIPMRQGGSFDEVIPIQEPNARTGKSLSNRQHGIGIGEEGDPMYTLNTKEHAIAFSAKDYGSDAGPISPTLRAGGHAASHANGGAMPAVAFHPTQDPISSTDGSIHALGTGSDGGSATAAVMTLAIRGCGEGCELEARDDGTANAILTPSGGRAGIGVGAIQHKMSVRRLTCVECERLQGFPDNWTLIPFATRRRKPADREETVAYLMRHGLSADEADKLADTPDGPRYKAIGNSMAVPCMAFIGRRIDAIFRRRAVEMNFF